MAFIMNIFENCVLSFLGPNKSVKFITDGKNTEIVCCPLQLLSTLQLKDPVNNLVSSAVQSHHARFGNGTSTLIAAFVLFYKNAFNSIEKEEINVCLLMSKIAQLLEHCLLFIERKKTFTFIKTNNIRDDRDKEFFINLNNIIQKLFSSNLASSSNTNKNPNEIFMNIPSPTNISPNKILKNSRHFWNENRIEDQETSQISCYKTMESNTNIQNTFLKACIKVDIEPVVQKIIQCCIHSEEDLGDLLKEVWMKQLKMKKLNCYNDLKFDVDKIHTLKLVSSPTNTAVTTGLVLPISAEMLYLTMKDNSPRRAMLIKGDISFNHKHKGFKHTFRCDLIETVSEMEISDINKWFKDFTFILQKLNVKLLMVEGFVSSEVMEYFLSANIVVLEGVSSCILRIVAENYKVPIETYLTDCDEDNVIENIVMEVFCPDTVNGTNRKNQNFIKINIDEFLTVIISSGSYPLSVLKEHKLWHLAQRLASCTSSSSMLINGQGKNEEIAIDWINSNFQSTSVLDILAKDILCSVFEDYIKIVNDNCQLLKNSPSVIVDNFHSVSEAWRSGLHLARTVLQTKYFIVVGGQDIILEERLSNEYRVIDYL